MDTKTLEKDKLKIERTLQEQEYTHLKVTKRGDKLVIYSDNGAGGKENRCRFIYEKAGTYTLNMANHTGKWETTPFEGSMEELLEMVMEQFPWTIANYDENGF